MPAKREKDVGNRSRPCAITSGNARCQTGINCGEYAEGATDFSVPGDRPYDTCYCMRGVLVETVKSCCQVGAHRKENKRNGTEFARKEYQKVCNRLWGRKNCGIISVDEWNRQVATVQELKAQPVTGKISDSDLARRFEEM